MSGTSSQVFFGRVGLEDRARVVFTGERTMFLHHEFMKWIITVSGSYAMLLNTATKLAPDTAEMKVDWCLLNLWHFYSCTVNILRWDENLSRTKDMAMPSWQIPYQEEVMQIRDANWGKTLFYWKILLFVWKYRKKKTPSPKSNNKIDAWQVFTSLSFYDQAKTSPITELHSRCFWIQFGNDVTLLNRSPWRYLKTHYNFWTCLSTGILNYLSCWPALNTDSPCCRLGHSMEHKGVQRSVKHE